MNKVTLIELSATDTQAIGTRILSSVARECGYDRSLVFMCGDNTYLRKTGGVVTFEDHIVDQVVRIAEGSRLVGVSFLTNFYDRAAQLTAAIKSKLGVPVIWGGVHTTARPMEALQHADMACLGEGENSFAELLAKIRDNKPYTDTAGIWFRENGNIIQNPRRPLEQDLDKFPMQDYDLDGQHYYDKTSNQIKPLTFEDFRALSKSWYSGNMYCVMMTRGCPSLCSFCYNSTWRETYKGQKYVRSRSVDNTLLEIAEIKRKFPFIGWIMFADDDFFAKNRKMTTEFAEKYPERVGVPFWAQATPATVDEATIEKLVGAGLRCVSMGIQTASGKISQIYSRAGYDNETIVKAGEIYHRIYEKYHHIGFWPPEYDFILDSPWETEDDSFDNIEMLLRFKKPYKIRLAALRPFPGTKISEKAHAEHLIGDEVNEVYRRPFQDKSMTMLKGSFANLLLIYFEFLPSWMVRVLSGKKVRHAISGAIPGSVFKSLMRCKRFVDLSGKLMSIIRAGDMEKLRSGFRKAFGRA